MRRALLLIAFAVAIAASVTAQAVDVLIPGTASLVTAQTVAKFTASSAATIAMPQRGSAEDPTLHGAQIRVFDVGDPLGFGGGEFFHVLPAAGWRALGFPAGSAGYLYRGSAAGDAVCRAVRISHTGIRAVCKGSAVTLDPPFRGGQGIVLGVPSVAASAAIRFCADFGGETRRNDDRRLLRRNAPAPAACPVVEPAPNFIVINLDDTRFDGIDRMPVLQNRLVDEGVSFSESFVPNAVCCPSRASLLTGRYSIHHGTRTIAGPIGGADTFRVSGADQQTIAVWLQSFGYATGLFGKYLNDYGPTEADKGPGGTFYIPPGWERWRAFVGAEHYGGVIGQTYEIIDENRTRTIYDDHSTDAQYSTDVLGEWMRDFVDDAVAANRPFFAYWTPYASHSDNFFPAPAQRHNQDLVGMLSLWRPPNWNEADVSDKPRWVNDLLPPNDVGFTDLTRRLAYETLLSVDEQLGMLIDRLETLGVADNTLILLTSDNGASWGEHRLFLQIKECPYEACIRVPMLARYPRGAESGVTVDAPVLNIDIAPTLLELTGAPIPPGLDGRSFAARLTPDPDPVPRRDFLMEHFRQVRNDVIGYAAQVADGDQFRLFHGDPLARPRISTLFEFDTDASVAAGAVAVPIGADEDASFANLGLAVVSAVPRTQRFPFPNSNQLGIVDNSPNADGIYWRVERDHTGTARRNGPPNGPDFVGVRDVAAGYTYVEYETNEVELYDLDADPWQLENKADDPLYAAIRAQLAARLDGLLAGQP